MRVRPPKGEKICLGLMCTVTQNFMLTGAAVTKISVTRQPSCADVPLRNYTLTHSEKKTPTNISFHTNVWRVNVESSLAYLG